MVVLVLVPSSLSSKQHFTEQQVISYAKALDVSKLDPMLSSQRLDQWLRFGPAHLDTATRAVGTPPISLEPALLRNRCGGGGRGIRCARN